MKRKQKEELKSKTKEELKKIVKDSQDLIFKLRIEKSQNKLKNLRQIFNERKKIAMAKTFINEKNKLEEIEDKRKGKDEKK